MNLQISIPIGDAFDKLSILEIKEAHATDKAQLKNIQTEIKSLKKELSQFISPDIFNEGVRVLPYVFANDKLQEIYDRLKATNLEMWNIEDSIRLKEKDKDFGAEFIQLARDVYYTNDRRCREKNEISTLLGSELIEEKIYQDYE